MFVQAGGWFGLITAAIAFYIAFAELTNDTLKKDVFPLGPFTWHLKFFHTPAQPCKSPDLCLCPCTTLVACLIH